MKLTTRGFTLVELMIVIAIIGILAAALFPSMTGYLKRSRDAARTAHLNDITKAAGAFFADKDKYPGKSATNCLSSSDITTTYMPKGIPADPSAGRPNGSNGCTANNGYGYSSGNVNGAPGFQLLSMFENEFGGNTGGTLSQNTGAYLNSDLTSVPTFQKGTGSGYVLIN